MNAEDGMRRMVVAERRLQVAGRRRPIVARVMMPRPSKKGDWECGYQVLGIGEGRLRTAHGLDALQALVLALGALEQIAHKSGLELTWEGGEPGDHGLPAFVPMYFGPAFSKRMSRLIEREAEKFALRQVRASGQAGVRQLRGKLAWKGDLRRSRVTRHRDG